MKYLIFALFLAHSALASDVGTATPELCKSKGMTFIKASTHKNGIHVRAYCRKKPHAKTEVQK